MNTVVNLELAKLLKEKGFDSPSCRQCYHGDFGSLVNGDYPFLGTYTLLENHPIKNKYSWKFQAPTVAEVIMWLYEKHGIWIEVRRYIRDGLKCLCPYIDNTPINEDVFFNNYDSPTEAYKAAINYTLKELI